jgi:hypothetical protein
MRVAVGVIGAVTTAICVLALVLFGLDAVQTRAQVRPEMRTSFHVASITAAVKTLFAAVTFGFLSVSALKGRARGAREGTTARPALIPVEPSRSTTPAGR